MGVLSVRFDRVRKKLVGPGFALVAAFIILGLGLGLPAVGWVTHTVGVVVVWASIFLASGAAVWLFGPWPRRPDNGSSAVPTSEYRYPLASIEQTDGTLTVYSNPKGLETGASPIAIAGGLWAVHAAEYEKTIGNTEEDETDQP
jgi:hypothetical protein